MFWVSFFNFLFFQFHFSELQEIVCGDSNLKVSGNMTLVGLHATSVYVWGNLGLVMTILIGCNTCDGSGSNAANLFLTWTYTALFDNYRTGGSCPLCCTVCCWWRKVHRFSSPLDINSLLEILSVRKYQLEAVNNNFYLIHYLPFKLPSKALANENKYEI